MVAPLPTAPQAAFRPEIHGLRGLGIVLVVAFHLWTNGRVSGGVDVFLFISAYLMTGSFLRKGRAFGVIDFLVQRFRRLVPQAAIVIAATLVGGWLILPPTRWIVLADHAQASLFYVENWRLIEQATNYTAIDPGGVSPYQHFWSLSVQGQTFLLWPLMFALILGLNRVTSWPITRIGAVLFGSVTLGSFAYAVAALQRDAASAYFDTWARLWEFSLASLLALVPALKIPGRWAAVMGWAGLAGLLSCGLLVGRQPFPGPVALWPLLSAALVVLAGAHAADRGHAAYWLSRRPVGFIANRAYALYLWHWPVYAYFLVATDNSNPRTGVVGSAVILTVSLLLADATTRVMERGFHRLELVQSRPGALVTIATFTLIAVGLAQGFVRFVDRENEATRTQPPEQQAGARAVTPGATPTQTPVRRSIAPGDAAIVADWPIDAPLCEGGPYPLPPEHEGTFCRELRTPSTPRGLVVVVGDSHSYQWLTALRPLAEENGWWVFLVNRPSCRLSQENPASDAGCVEYSRLVVDWIVELGPDYVVNVASRAQADGPELAVETYADAIAPVARSGIPVVNIRDNPRWEFTMPECVQRYGSTDPRCLGVVPGKLAETWPRDGLDELPNQYYLDFTDKICPDGECRGVIGNVYVYMDDNHLSRTYVETLADEFARRWKATVRA